MRGHPSGLDERILEILAAGPRLRLDLAAELAASGSSVQKAIYRLRDQGAIEVVDHVPRGRKNRPAIVWGLAEGCDVGTEFARVRARRALARLGVQPVVRVPLYVRALQARGQLGATRRDEPC